MRPGTLRHRVQLQSVSETPATSGEMTQTWSTFATVWANVTPTGMSELVRGDKVVAARSMQVTIRYSSDVAELSPKDRIRYGDRVLQIESVLNVEERNEELTILCSEVV